MDRLLPWLRRSGWAYVALALALSAAAWWMSRGGADGVSASAVPPARPATVERAAAPGVLVHVAGEVRKPGVYRVAGGGRVIAAVKRAGGPTRHADLSGLNLAARLQDGQQVVVPARAVAGAASPSPPADAPAPISLSRATVEQLDALDGIGPTLAARIVSWRQEHGGFASVDQLLEVPGIGQTRLEALRQRVVP